MKINDIFILKQCQVAGKPGTMVHSLIYLSISTRIKPEMMKVDERMAQESMSEEHNARIAVSFRLNALDRLNFCRKKRGKHSFSVIVSNF